MTSVQQQQHQQHDYVIDSLRHHRSHDNLSLDHSTDDLIITTLPATQSTEKRLNDDPAGNDKKISALQKLATNWLLILTKN